MLARKLTRVLIIYILMQVTCLFVLEKLPGACIDRAGNLSLHFFSWLRAAPARNYCR